MGQLQVAPTISETGLLPRDVCTPALIAALFTIARVWKQPRRPSVDEQTKKCQRERRERERMEEREREKHSEKLEGVKERG